MNRFYELADEASATIKELTTEREWKRRALADASSSHQRVINAKNLHDLHMDILSMKLVDQCSNCLPIS
jgi:hypothetical protein